MPNTPAKIFHQLGVTDESLKAWKSIKSFGALKAGTVVNKGEIIFPRVELKAEEPSTAAAVQPVSGKDKKKNTKKNTKDNYIINDDFAKIDLRVAKVLGARRLKAP